MKLAPLDIINFIALFQLLVFTSFLVRRRTRRHSNMVLAVFLFAQFMIIFNFECMNLSGYVLTISPHLYQLGAPFILLAAPSFYLYVKSLAFEDFKLSVNHLWHAIPFVAGVVLFSISFYFSSAQTKTILIESGGIFTVAFWITFNLLIFAQLLGYFLADLHILRYYRRELRQLSSSIKNANLSWLTVIITTFIVAWLSSVVVFFSRNYFWQLYSQLQFCNFLAFFLFFNYIFYKGLTQPEIFAGVEEKPKYAGSKLTETEADDLLRELDSHMSTNMPYLNPTLSLKELAEQLKTSPRFLSQVINERTRQNFYDYVSGYRIERAKAILADRDAGKTVLEVLYEVGFNSKSSFNTAFKKFSGVTPSQFKKEAGSNPD